MEAIREKLQWLKSDRTIAMICAACVGFAVGWGEPSRTLNEFLYRWQAVAAGFAALVAALWTVTAMKTADEAASKRHEETLRVAEEPDRRIIEFQLRRVMPNLSKSERLMEAECSAEKMKDATISDRDRIHTTKWILDLPGRFLGEADLGVAEKLLSAVAKECVDRFRRIHNDFGWDRIDKDEVQVQMEEALHIIASLRIAFEQMAERYGIPLPDERAECGEAVTH